MRRATLGSILGPLNALRSLATFETAAAIPTYHLVSPTPLNAFST